MPESQIECSFDAQICLQDLEETQAAEGDALDESRVYGFDNALRLEVALAFVLVCASGWPSCGLALCRVVSMETATVLFEGGLCCLVYKVSTSFFILYF